MREALDAFKPDIVLIWGDDQYENFKRDCIPAFCVGIYDKVVSHRDQARRLLKDLDERKNTRGEERKP